MKKLSSIYQSETDEKVPTIGVPSQSNIIPFTQDEVDSLNALRDKEYDPHERERKLMGLASLASLLVAPVNQLFKAVTIPIQGGSSRLAAYFGGKQLLPVTRSATVKGSVAGSPQEA